MKKTTDGGAVALMKAFGDDVYPDETQFSKVANIPIPTLRTWRSRGGGPPFVKVGRRIVRYHWRTAKEYFQKRTFGEIQ